MQGDDVRWLFAYDRWATHRILNVLDGLNPAVWTRPNVVGDRGLGGILAHHLGASMRWRVSFESQGEDEGRHLEREPMPTVDELRDLWQADWAAVDAWLPTLTDAFIGNVFDGVPVWPLAHRGFVQAVLVHRRMSPRNGPEAPCSCVGSQAKVMPGRITGV